MTLPNQSDFNREALQRDLLALFARYDVRVAVGLSRDGVAIRSQDDRVSASDLGTVRILSPEGNRS